jgi:hypothetical protein
MSVLAYVKLDINESRRITRIAAVIATGVRCMFPCRLVAMQQNPFSLCGCNFFFCPRAIIAHASLAGEVLEATLFTLDRIDYHRVWTSAKPSRPVPGVANSP